MQTITQTQIAEKLGVTGGCVSDILRGRREISKSIAIKIKDSTGLSLDFVLCNPPVRVFEAVRIALQAESGEEK